MTSLFKTNVMCIFNFREQNGSTFTFLAFGHFYEMLRMFDIKENIGEKRQCDKVGFIYSQSQH